MDGIDYAELKTINYYEYDITPNEKGEIMVVFKVGDKSCCLPIPKKDLESMLWFAKKK